MRLAAGRALSWVDVSLSSFQFGEGLFFPSLFFLPLFRSRFFQMVSRREISHASTFSFCEYPSFLSNNDIDPSSLIPENVFPPRPAANFRRVNGGVFFFFPGKKSNNVPLPAFFLWTSAYDTSPPVPFLSLIKRLPFLLESLDNVFPFFKLSSIFLTEELMRFFSLLALLFSG